MGHNQEEGEEIRCRRNEDVELDAWGDTERHRIKMSPYIKPPGSRKIGRQRSMWMDAASRDMTMVGLERKMADDMSR